MIKTHPIAPLNEIWTPITENVVPDILPYYEISNYGRVRSKYYSQYRIMYTYLNSNGYAEVVLCLKHNYKERNAKTFFVHRLVLASFAPIKGWKELEVNHKDSIPYNNCLWNLEWTTRLENLQYAYNLGSYGSGETSHNNILSENIVIEICKTLDYNSGISIPDICKLFPELNCVTKSSIYNIRDGTSWYCISKYYNFLLSTIMKTFSDENLKYIYENINLNPRLILINLGFKIPEYKLSRRQVRLINLIDKIQFDYARGICYLRS